MAYRGLGGLSNSFVGEVLKWDGFLTESEKLRVIFEWLKEDKPIMLLKRQADPEVQRVYVICSVAAAFPLVFPAIILEKEGSPL
jgi:hypothetical protein